MQALQRCQSQRTHSGPARSQLMLLRPISKHYIRANFAVFAAAGAGGRSDPYKVLGLEPDADNNAVNRAYRLKKYEARGNDELSAQIEAAHSQLMFSSLNARLKGNVRVSRDVLYADREQLFPWRPKRWDATPKVIAIVGAMQLGIILYAFQSPGISKAVFAMLIGMAGNIMKQNAISPPPKDPETATEEESGRAGRNFVRGVLLGLMATVSGVLLFSLPEVLSQQAKVVLPAVLASSSVAVSLKVAGAAFSNWVITSFYY